MPLPNESSKIGTHKAKISGQLDSKRDSHQMLLKLEFRELHDLKVTGFSTFDRTAILLS